jgi:FkbM family methyltransferase
MLNTMPILPTVKRVIRTSTRILHDEGISGLSSAVRQRLLLKNQINAFGRTHSVALDGCTFSLKRLPESQTKLHLLQNKYEEFERRAVLQYAPPEIPVIELGACIGVVACITNRALKSARPHVVVEASPLAIPLIEENRSLNQCDFEIVNAAIAYGQQTVTFTPSLELLGNSLNQSNTTDPVTVNTIRLDDIVTRKKIESFTLICDIEGHEYDLVQHEADVLKHAEIIILETHAWAIGETKNLELLGRLHDIGFRKIDEESSVLVLRRSA